jgi:hypothetical protein
MHSGHARLGFGYQIKKIRALYRLEARMINGGDNGSAIQVNGMLTLVLSGTLFSLLLHVACRESYC